MKQSVSNKKISGILREIGEYLEMQDVVFKPRAYERAADVVSALDEELSSLYDDGGKQALMDLPGIGEAIAEKIEELLTTGRLQYHKELKKKMPVDLKELTALEDVGPKTVKALWEALGIKTVQELEKASEEGKIRELPGFGEKTEQNILRSIAFAKKDEGRFLLGKVLPDIRTVLAVLREHPATNRVEVAGSTRRYRETIGDVDIVITASDAASATEAFVSLPQVEEVILQGETKTRIRLESGLEVDMRVVEEDQFGSALQYFTGNKAHNVALRKVAKKKGYKLNEYGLFKEDRRVAGKTEEEIYTQLDYPSAPPPEMRRDTGELQALEKGSLPTPIGYGDLRGNCHTHTTWSDGRHSIQEMAEAARDAGLEYVAITDHSVSLKMVGGLAPDDIKRQIEEVRTVDDDLDGITLLTGLEVDITKDGTLDTPDDVLAELDYVTASVHSYFSLSESTMTKRIIKALRNPHVDALSHPTGRLLRKREAYAVNMEQVIAVAAEEGTALEINAQPDRIDIHDTYIRMAVEAGAVLVINADAHHQDHFWALELGIGQARRGWATKDDVVNTKNTNAFRTWLKNHRNH